MSKLKGCPIPPVAPRTATFDAKDFDEENILIKLTLLYYKYISKKRFLKNIWIGGQKTRKYV